MDDKEVIKIVKKELDKREEDFKEMIRTEIKNAEKRRLEKEMIKDPSSYHKRYREIN
jgi:hypothetical protein